MKLPQTALLPQAHWLGLPRRRLLAFGAIFILTALLLSTTAVRIRDSWEMKRFLGLLQAVDKVRLESAALENAKRFASENGMTFTCDGGYCRFHRVFQSWFMTRVMASQSSGVSVVLLHNTVANWLGVRPWIGVVEFSLAGAHVDGVRFEIVGETAGHRDFAVFGALCTNSGSERVWYCDEKLPEGHVEVSINGGLKAWHGTGVPVRVIMTSTVSPQQRADVFNVGFDCITRLIPCRTYRDLYPITRTDELLAP